MRGARTDPPSATSAVHGLAEGGASALHIASAAGGASHAACARILLRYGTLASLTDIDGQTALDVANDAPHRETAAVLAHVAARRN